MNYRTWIQITTNKLQAVGISSARLDTLLLLEYVTKRPRALLLAHDDTLLTKQETSLLDIVVERRINREPIAYIVGHKEFYGREFSITKSVLVPRPESEDIITLLLELPIPSAIIDVGTGSGALAVTAKLEIPTATVYATDIDPACITTAKQNAAALHADVTFIETDTITNLRSESLDGAVLLANLPYVPLDNPLNKDARHEPQSAIFSPENGLQHYRKLFEQCSAKPTHPSAYICESLRKQHAPLANLAVSYGLVLQKTEGLQQLFVPVAKP